MGVTSKTIKHLLLLINFLLTISTIILISFGIYLLVTAAHKEIVHGENVAGILLLTFGIAILFTILFGFMAILRESKRKLVIYLIIIIFIILIQLILSGMASYGTRDGIAGSINQGFNDLWQTELRAPGALAFYEDWLHCCGVNGTNDYHSINHNIPKTCYKDRNVYRVDEIYDEGCLMKFHEYLYDKMLMFNILDGIFILIEIVDVMLTWLFIERLKYENYRSNMRWI